METIRYNLNELTNYHNSGVLTLVHEEPAKTNGEYSIAGGGNNTTANGNFSFAFGDNVTTVTDNQVIFGKNGVMTPNSIFAIADSDDPNQSNLAFEISKNDDNSYAININGINLCEEILELSLKEEITIPRFDEIDNDNKYLENLIKKCAYSWAQAFDRGDVTYISMGNAERNKVINPLIYTKFSGPNNNIITDEIRDIYTETQRFRNDPNFVSSELADKERPINSPSLQCITYANMLLMGIPYEKSRLAQSENTIGAAGYGFDIGKLLGKQIKQVNTTLNDAIGSGVQKAPYTIKYNAKDTLNKDTFMHTLAGDWFYAVYDRLGLAKKLTPNTNIEELTPDILSYTQLKLGDIFAYGKEVEDKSGNKKRYHTHSMMVKSVGTQSLKDNGVSKKYENVIQVFEIMPSLIPTTYYRIGQDASDFGAIYKYRAEQERWDRLTYEVDGTPTDYTLVWMARPYYQYYENSNNNMISTPLIQLQDLDYITNAGFYRMRWLKDADISQIPQTSRIPNSYWTEYWYLTVTAYGNGSEHCTQLLEPVQGIYSSYKLRRIKRSGTWQPWEWENPPMTNVIDITTTSTWNQDNDYRTIEKYNGTPVYTFRFSFTVPPSEVDEETGKATSKFTIPLPPNSATMIRFSAHVVTAGNTKFLLPSSYREIQFNANRNFVYNRSGDAVKATDTVYGQVWYIVENTTN